MSEPVWTGGESTALLREPIPTSLPSRRLARYRRNRYRPIVAINVPEGVDAGLIRDWTARLTRAGIRGVVVVAPAETTLRSVAAALARVTLQMSPVSEGRT